MIPPVIPDVMHQVLSIEVKFTRLTCAFTLLGELHLGLAVPFEERDLLALEKMELARAEKLQFPLDHHRRP